MSAAHLATDIQITWTDGLTHHFMRQSDDTWTLTLGGIPDDGGLPRVTGYRREDLERVLGTAMKGTAA